jgi:diaminopimelate decarboxylase
VESESGIEYRAQQLCCDDVPLEDIAAACGTPTYVYSASGILARFRRLQRAIEPVPSMVCFAVKTNSNLAVLGTLARAGAGFDIVSGGELYRLQRVGVAPGRVVFAGVGKTRDEMMAAVRWGIGSFNLESVPEARALAAVAAEQGVTARVALRVNPDLEAGGHRYVSTGTSADKFGIAWRDVPAAWAQVAALPGLEPRGLHCHVGSQILAAETFGRAARRLADLARTLRAAGHRVDDLNLGGGLGIRYRDEVPLDPETFAAAVLPEIRPLGVRLLVEPGRSIVGACGVLLARVVYRKETDAKVFLVVDAGMNDLVRPSLYGSHHGIAPLRLHPDRPREHVDVVGPLCESGDFLARGRELSRVEPGEGLAVLCAGAYGFAMSSNYNSRPRAAEVLVRGGEYRVVRQRESPADLIRAECDWSDAEVTA